MAQLCLLSWLPSHPLTPQSVSVAVGGASLAPPEGGELLQPQQVRRSSSSCSTSIAARTSSSDGCLRTMWRNCLPSPRAGCKPQSTKQCDTSLHTSSTPYTSWTSPISSTADAHSSFKGKQGPSSVLRCPALPFQPSACIHHSPFRGCHHWLVLLSYCWVALRGQE